MKQKTIKIAGLIKRVNELNAKSLCSPEIRQGWNALLEDILHQTDNYSGYNYLMQSEVPEGAVPGCISSEGKNIFPDETRRRYY